MYAVTWDQPCSVITDVSPLVGPSATFSFEGTLPIQTQALHLPTNVQYALVTALRVGDFEYPLIRIP